MSRKWLNFMNESHQTTPGIDGIEVEYIDLEDLNDNPFNSYQHDVEDSWFLYQGDYPGTTLNRA